MSTARNSALVIDGFNPLPPPKRGETSGSRTLPGVNRPVSIHSPRRSEGRLIIPMVSKGAERSKFQSTPPAEARGDLSAGS